MKKKDADADAQELEDQELEDQVSREIARLERARRERPGALAQVAHLGVLGLGFAVPIVAGAYLGRFLDERAGGYSMRWTLSLILVGVAIGAVNAYLSIRE